jgi:hypothetical protein
MSRYPKIKLSIVRQIGWDHWDPIGIRGFGGDDWQTNAADEYDSYLLHIVSLLHSGKSEVDAVEYLDVVASEHMGLGPRSQEEHQASANTVRAIAAYLRTLPDGPLSVR